MGMDGKESNGPTWLQAQLAAVVAGAIQTTLLLQARPEGLGDISVNDIALVAAADMTEQFNILPKDQQEYAICEWNPYFAEPSRGSYIGGWTPVSDDNQRTSDASSED